MKTLYRTAFQLKSRCPESYSCLYIQVDGSHLNRARKHRALRLPRVLQAPRTNQPPLSPHFPFHQTQNLKSSNPSTATHHLHHQNILLYHPHPSPSPSQTHSFFIFISAPQLAPTPLLHTAHPHPPNFVARRSGGLPLTYVCATSGLADGTFIRWLIRWRVKRGLERCCLPCGPWE